MIQKSWLNEVDQPLESWSAKITVAICGFAKEQKIKLLRRPSTPDVMNDVRKKVKIFQEKLEEAYELITTEKPQKRKNKHKQVQESSASRSQSPLSQSQPQVTPVGRLEDIRVLSEPRSQSKERPRLEYEPTPVKPSSISRGHSQRKQEGILDNLNFSKQNNTNPGRNTVQTEVKEEVESSDQNLKVFAEEPEGADILQCPACPKQFYQLESSLKHVIEHLPPQKSCVFCKQVFEEESDIIPHLTSVHMPLDRLLQLKKINQFYFRVNPQQAQEGQNPEDS